MAAVCIVGSKNPKIVTPGFDAP